MKTSGGEERQHFDKKSGLRERLNVMDVSVLWQTTHDERQRSTSESEIRDKCQILV